MTVKTYCDRCGATPADETFQYDSPRAGPGPLRGTLGKDLDMCRTCYAALLAHLDRFFPGTTPPGGPPDG